MHKPTEEQIEAGARNFGCSPEEYLEMWTAEQIRAEEAVLEEYMAVAYEANNMVLAWAKDVNLLERIDERCIVWRTDKVGVDQSRVKLWLHAGVDHDMFFRDHAELGILPCI